MARPPTQSSPFSTSTGSVARLADEGEDEGRVGLVVDVVGRADLLDSALAHDDETVGELEGFFLIVGHEDGGVAGLVVDLAEPLAELLADLRVEGAEGLVEEQHARFDREGAGEGDALALAAGELLGIALVEAGELDEVEELHRAPADFVARRPGFSRANLESERDVLEHRHVAEERIGLEDEADVAILDGL